MKTYSSRPMICLDGADSAGVRAEVMVIVGKARAGDITIKPSDSGNAYNAIFSVDNTKHKISAWFPKDDPIDKRFSDLNDDDIVEFRIEKRRKRGVDRTTPISDLIKIDVAQESIDKSLAAIKFERDEEWTYSPWIVTNPDEDPDTSGFHSAFKQKGDATSKPTSVSTDSFEAVPYKVSNADGSVNLGSTAIQSAISFYSFVVEETNKNDLVSFSEDEAKHLAKLLVNVANRAQVEVYNGKLSAPDMGLGSNVRARAIVFDVVRNFYPITEELKTSAEAKKWARSVTDKTVEMWKWSAGIVKHFA